MIIQAILGDSMAIIPGRIEPGVSGQETRILPPGQMLVYVMFVSSSVYVVISKSIKNRVLCYILFSLCGVGVLLTYNRSYWVSYFLVISIFFIFTNKNNRYKLLSRIVSPIIIFLLLFFMFSVFSPGQLIDNYFDSISTRVFSLFMGEDLYESDSIDFRKEENVAAMEAILSRPFFGSGLGSKYRSIPDKGFEGRESYIHNGYLWVLLKMGLLGAIPIILFFTFFITRLIKDSIHETNSNYRSLMLCGAFAILGITFINIVNPVIMQDKSIVVIAITMGLLRVLEKNSTLDSETNDIQENN
jgi:O-antigen ligase